MQIAVIEIAIEIIFIIFPPIYFYVFYSGKIEYQISTTICHHLSIINQMKQSTNGSAIIAPMTIKIIIKTFIITSYFLFSFVFMYDFILYKTLCSKSLQSPSSFLTMQGV